MGSALVVVAGADATFFEDVLSQGFSGSALQAEHRPVPKEFSHVHVEQHQGSSVIGSSRDLERAGGSVH